MSCCTPKRFKVCSFVSAICFVIFLVLVIVFPILIQNLIVSQAKDKAIMRAENQNLWGEVPGDSQAQVTRSFKFYNFTNPEEFLFENQIPEFDEIGNFIYQEFQNFTNYNISLDNATGMEKIDYNFWQYYKLISGDDQQNITTLNLGSLGAWYQFKTSPKKKLAVQAFAGVIYTLEKSVNLVAASQGIWAQFIQTKQNLINVVFEPAGNVPAALYDSLWSDEMFGWGNWISLRSWILAAQSGVNSHDAYVIRDYFGLTYEQMFGLLTGTLSDWVESINDLLKEWYCDGKDPCDGEYLSALQLAKQGITMNPPAGTIPALPSIVSTNDTLRGCPEISLFLSEVFLRDNQYNTSQYRNLTFSTEWMLGLINHTRNDSKDWLKDQHIILHVGNIDFLFTEGDKFVKSSNVSDFENVRIRFRLETNYHAHVFWAWANYIAEEFAMQKSRNGTIDQASIGGFLSLEMVKIYNKANDYLLLEVLSNLMFYNITKNNISCIDFFTSSSLNQTTAEKVCSLLPEFSQRWNFSADGMKTMINVCWYKRDYFWVAFTNITNLTNMEVEFICGSANTQDPKSFGSIKKYSDQRLHDFYDCEKVSRSCSQTEFTAKQWGNSSITRNVLPELSAINKKFVNSYSLKDWEPEMFPKMWEYYAVLEKYPNFTTNNTVKGFNTSVSRIHLSYQRFFNQMIRFAIIDYNFNYTEDIIRLFKTDDPKALYNYIKYMMINHVLNGMTTIKTVKELLWGYKNSFIHKIKTLNPQEGGDPSLPDTVSLMTNITYDTSFNNTQSVFSGETDVSKVRMYKEIYGIPYVTFNDTAFNGNDSYVLYTNPWVNKTDFGGTDSFGNSPNIDKNSKVYIYVTDLFKGGYGVCNGETHDYNGVEALTFRLPESYMQNKENNPENANFYLDRWNGLLNLTSIKKLPLMLSKYSHLGLDLDAHKNVKIYIDKNRTTLLTPDSKYDVQIDVEPYSGAGLSATLNLQANYEYQQDNLFSNPNYGLLPVFSLKRSGTWTDEAIENQFGMLKLGLKLKLILEILFYVMAAIFILLCIFMFYKYRKSQNAGKDETLLPSNNGETKIDGQVLK